MEQGTTLLQIAVRTKHTYLASTIDFNDARNTVSSFFNTVSFLPFLFTLSVLHCNKRNNLLLLLITTMSLASFLLVFLCCGALPALADPRATELAVMCTNTTAPMLQRQAFLTNFYDAMEALTDLITSQRYALVVKGTTQNETVYAFGECMKDLSKPDCDVCFAQCKTRVHRCSPFQRGTNGGMFFFDGCYLRYDGYNFFNESLSPRDRTICGTEDFRGNWSVFKANTVELVRNLSIEAPKNEGFSAGYVRRSNVTIYGLAQCWKFVNSSSCQNCLAEAITRIDSCAPKGEVRALNAGCYLRYATHNFYNSSNNNPPQEHRGELVPLLEDFSFLCFSRSLLLK